MKRINFSLEGLFNNLKHQLDPELYINEVELEDFKSRIKIYNIQGFYYISVSTFQEILYIYAKIPKNETLFEFFLEMVSICKIEDTTSGNKTNELELCRIDQLTDSIFDLLRKKYEDLSKIEDESIFEKIDISQNKSNSLNLNNEFPFEQSWSSSDFANTLNNIYTANNFLDIPNQPCHNTFELPKKAFGRGRSRSRQVDIKDRPFICEYPECKRAFKRFEHLKRHNKMHTGERPYKCKYPGCLKTFSRSDNLAQHSKIHNVSTKSQSLTFQNYYGTNKDLD